MPFPPALYRRLPQLAKTCLFFEFALYSRELRSAGDGSRESLRPDPETGRGPALALVLALALALRVSGGQCPARHLTAARAQERRRRIARGARNIVRIPDVWGPTRRRSGRAGRGRGRGRAGRAGRAPGHKRKYIRASRSLSRSHSPSRSPTRQR